MAALFDGNFENPEPSMTTSKLPTPPQYLFRDVSSGFSCDDRRSNAFKL
jgi:hypothetical protein